MKNDDETWWEVIHEESPDFLNEILEIWSDDEENNVNGYTQIKAFSNKEIIEIHDSIS